MGFESNSISSVIEPNPVVARVYIPAVGVCEGLSVVVPVVFSRPFGSVWSSFEAMPNAPPKAA